MASIVETTAVALRRGNHESNLNFRGVQGEVSVDLGTQTNDGVLGTDNETTLRLHNGITKGGIPMCRADMRNMTTEALAKDRGYLGDKNLAYADLSNVEQSASPSAINNLIDILVRYGLITDETVQEYLQAYALKNMSNVNTTDLATSTGHLGKNLAYADTSNINTSDLTNSLIHDGSAEKGKTLAYSDSSNLNTTQLTTTPFAGPALAKKDLSNVPSSFWENLLINTYNVETKNNKDNIIPENDEDIVAGHYPETSADKQYVDNAVISGTFLNKNFDNASTFEPLYSNSIVQIYQYDAKPSYITDAGSNFVLDKKYPIMSLDNEVPLEVIVNTVDANGVPTSISLSDEFGNYSYSENALYIVSSTNTKCYFDLTSTYNNTLQLYEYTATINTSMTNEGGFVVNNTYKIFDNISTDFIINEILYFIPTEIDASGSVLNYMYSPSINTTNITATSFTINNTAGENAVVEFYKIKTLPDIGGAGLLKTDFTNLRGMTQSDISSETNAPWRINHTEEIPNSNIPLNNKWYYDIANIGSIWNALYGNDNSLVHKDKTETITGSKTFTDYITSLGLRAYSADLAELYEADADYPIGTLIKFGGEKEITIADLDEVNGVISEKPAILLNKDCKGLPIALTGKTKIRVKGKVNKFDKLTNFYNGVAIKKLLPEHKTIAIALEDKITDEEGLVMCVTKLSL